MADYTPIFTGGTAPFTMQASATIVGGTPVASSGVGTVATAAADSTVVLGIAAHDAASGAKVTVLPIDGATHEVAVQAAGTVTAGDGVVVGTSGTVKTATIATAAAAGTLIGIAETTATAPALVRFFGRN